jgi:hypothetical protein
MTSHHTTSRLSLVLLACILITLGVAAIAQAAEAPVKEVFKSHIGWDVNKTKEQANAPQAERNICTVFSKEECQLGAFSGEPGGFGYPKGVAVNTDPASPEHGDLYITDLVNHRVQVLTAAGAFVSMFGEQVNETTGGNICTAASGNVCQAGAGGSETGALQQPEGITANPSTGDVYVQDEANWRVDEYTADGQFVAMFGREVNETKDNATPPASEAEKNICTATSKDTCKAGVQGTPGAGEHDAFDFAGSGDVMTVAGPGDTLYVGDENRVQELKPDGTWIGEIPVSATVKSLAVDDKTGTMYVVYNQEPVIHEFDIASNAELPGAIEVPGAFVDGMAVDSAGYLAVSANGEGRRFADLYEASGGHLIGAITIPGMPVEPLGTLNFGENGDLYGLDAQEVFAYALELVGEVAGGAAVCAVGPASGSSATFGCTLSGEVNPEGVAETEALFQWGKTAGLGQQTAGQDVGEPKTVEAVFVGLRPNETLFYELTAYDQNVQAPEQLVAEERSVTTESVPPKVLGSPSVSFVTSSSAVLSGELNPENTNTLYEFQYAKACIPGEPCPAIANAPEMLATSTQESAAYGELGTTAEVGALQPLTSYRYRLAAVNEKGQEAVSATGGSVLPEGTFTTGPAPAPAVSTGLASEVGTSSATIAGSVNPGGLPATYSFELGVYEGASTQYGDVFSGPVGTGSTPLEETLALTGLQPGTTYAYRIAVHSGYTHNTETALQGTTTLFTTAGVPAVLSVSTPLAQLATPTITFPQATTVTTKRASTCKHGSTRNKRDKCVKTKRKRKTKAAGGRKQRKRK